MTTDAPSPSPKRQKRLGQLATDTGQFAILAIDHVGSFAEILDPERPRSVTADAIRGAKVQLVEGLGPHATAVLVDPAFCTSATLPELGFAQGKGLILGIEDGDYADAHVEPRLLEGWDVERAVALGADAVKVSFYFDADGDTSAAERFVTGVLDQCAALDVPLFCEPLAIGGEPGDTKRLVLEGVKRFGALGPDILKIRFPYEVTTEREEEAWLDACGRIEQESPVPWTLLSEGKEFGLFRDMLGVACRAGASGFLGGRAVWRDAVTGASNIEAAAARLDELRAVVVAEGAHWMGRYLRADSAPVEQPS